jgi:hypothetical protein
MAQLPRIAAGTRADRPGDWTTYRDRYPRVDRRHERPRSLYRSSDVPVRMADWPARHKSDDCHGITGLAAR